MMAHCRKPEIMADAAHIILTGNSRDFTGRFCMDDVLLHENGVNDFDQYAVDPTKELWPDFFVPDDVPPPPGSMGNRTD
jgi:citronellol/citronellal dehydrogenase